MLSFEEVRKLFHYDPLTGKFTRLLKTARRNKIGDVVGCPDKNGYLTVTYKSKNYFIHRLAWLYMTGDWPQHGVDHEDRVPGNNIWTNLRDADKSENGQNQNLSVLNKSGYTGVSWCKSMKKWQAQIGIKTNGKRKVYALGFFDCPKEASEIYKQAKKDLHIFNPVTNLDK